MYVIHGSPIISTENDDWLNSRARLVRDHGGWMPTISSVRYIDHRSSASISNDLCGPPTAGTDPNNYYGPHMIRMDPRWSVQIHTIRMAPVITDTTQSELFQTQAFFSIFTPLNFPNITFYQMTPALWPHDLDRSHDSRELIKVENSFAASVEAGLQYVVLVHLALE